MPELQWFEVNLPRDLDLAAVTALVRIFANRPRSGFGGHVSPVAFELWSIRGDITYLLGVDQQLARSVPIEMKAQLPRLDLVAVRSRRPMPHLATDVRLQGMAAPLRLDTASAVSAGLLAGLRDVGSGSAVVQWVLGPAHSRRIRPMPFSVATSLGFRTPRREASAARLWRDKAGAEPLFACRGRIGASAASPAAAYNIVRNLAGALKLTSSQHASLQISKASAGRARKLIEIAAPTPHWSCVLNAAEIAGALGWPLGAVPVEGLPVIGGHINPVAAALRLTEDEAIKRPGDRLLGESLHPGERGDLVTMPISASRHHAQIIGPTGSGKSSLLCRLICADIAAGRSVLVIEPRGDLVADVLARIPAHRRDDIVLIDPANAEQVVGVNVLAGPRAEAERRADDLVHLLAQTHSANWGPRTADIALHAMIAISRLKDGALTDVPVLLSNPAFRRRVLSQVSDPLTLGPFFAGFDALSDAERGQHVAPLLNKLRPIMSRAALRRMLGQDQPKFDLGELFTKRRVVLVNLNRGLLGTPTANLLGALILSQAWSAIQRRAAVPTAKRHPVMMVVDEFQDYLGLAGGLDFGDALAQSRGLAVSWTLAHQHLDQLSATQRAGIFANARSRVVFRPSTNDAKPLATALGGGLTADDLLRLRAFQACCQLHVDGQPTQPFSIRTRSLPPWTSDPAELRRLSGERYGVDGDEVDRALTERWQGGGVTPDAPVGVQPRRAS